MLGMTEITLVLPFALPPPQLAPDLIRALQAPALAALLARGASYRRVSADSAARALPHELWLARTLGLGVDGKLAPAAAAMRGFGLDPADASWLIVNPAHFEIARSHLLMTDLRRLGLAEAHSRALFDSAKPWFDEIGSTLLYGDAHTWFMRADGWAGLDTATPDAATGMNLTDWLPSGPHATDYRKLQNEVQMLWYEHPANAAREAAGLAAVNGFWPWGAGKEQPSPSFLLASADAPPWLSAIARRPDADFADLIGELAQPIVFYCGGAAEAAFADDWSGWLMQMQRLEENVFSPALGALAQGRVGQLRLVLDRRDALCEITTTRMAQRTFWRRPTLDRLLP
jgi:hypothetical protein